MDYDETEPRPSRLLQVRHIIRQGSDSPETSLKPLNLSLNVGKYRLVGFTEVPRCCDPCDVLRLVALGSFGLIDTPSSSWVTFSSIIVIPLALSFVENHLNETSASSVGPFDSLGSPRSGLTS